MATSAARCTWSRLAAQAASLSRASMAVISRSISAMVFGKRFGSESVVARSNVLRFRIWLSMRVT